MLVLSRLRFGLPTHLGSLSLERQGAFAAERRVPPPRIVDPVDVLEDRTFGLASGFPAVAPDQLCLEGFEERLDHGIVVTIAFAAHGYFETML